MTKLFCDKCGDEVKNDEYSILTETFPDYISLNPAQWVICFVCCEKILPSGVKPQVNHIQEVD